MSSAIFSFLGWSILPDFVTNKLQEFYYNFAYRVGAPKPQPGTPVWVKHRRRIYFSVIVVYLLYTLYEADWNIRRAGDFYTDLGVSYDVSEKELNSRFRRITLQFHPDKLSTSLSPAQRQEAEANYLHLQLAKDTLLDPAKRFAYDRLGADITEWKHAKTIRDFVVVGGRRMIPFYLGSIIAMVGAQWFGVFDTSGTYWRYLALVALLLFEFRTLTSPTPLPITSLSTLLNPLHNALKSLHLVPLTNLLTTIFATPRPAYLPFQSVQLAHRATITLFIALSRLAPLFTPPRPRGAKSAEEAEIMGMLQKLEGLAGAYTGDASRLLALEAIAFGEQGNATTEGGEASGYAKLLPHIKNFLVTNTVRQDPQVKAAAAAVLARRRGDAGVNGDVLGLDEGIQNSRTRDVREEEKTMEQMGWIASATSPESSFLVNGDGGGSHETNEAKEEEEKEQNKGGKETEEDSTHLTPSTASTQKRNSTSSSASSPFIHDATPHPHARRNSKGPQAIPTSPGPADSEAPPLPLLDPGELADTEGETPAPPSVHNHTHHKHTHSHSHKIGANGSMGASVELLGDSEIREAKKEMEKVEGYEGDVDV